MYLYMHIKKTKIKVFCKIVKNFKYCGVIEKWKKLYERSSAGSTLSCLFPNLKFFSIIVTYENGALFGMNQANFSLSQAMGHIIYIH